MFTGISTSCLYPLETEKSLALLLEGGARDFEVFLNTFSELELPYLKALARQAEENGARIRSVHPFSSGWEGYLFFSGYPRRIQDSLDFYRRFFEGAAILGADKVIFHGAHLGMEVPMDRYIQRYIQLDQAGREMGITVCHENVCRTASRSPAFFREMRREYPDAWFTLDIKQAIRADVDPAEMMEAMGDRVAHVHISDNAPGQSCLPPGKGTMDLNGFVERLGQKGYKGGVILELYRGNFAAEADLMESYHWLRQLPAIKNFSVYGKAL